MKISGFSVFAGRLPAALLGCISLLLLFRVADYTGGKLFACIALLLAELSPWHITHSRLAHEGAVLPSFFVILALYIYIKTRQSNYTIPWLIASGLVLGMSANVYQSTRFIFFLLSFYFIIEVAVKTLPDAKKIFILLFFLFLGASPQLWAAITEPEHFFARANSVLMGFSFSRGVLANLAYNFVSNLLPNYLFFSSGEYNYFTFGRLLSPEAPFFYLGLLVLPRLKSQTYNPSYLYPLLILCILPAAMAAVNPHSLRASAAILLFPMFTSAGVVFVYEKINIQLLRNIFFGVALIIIVSGAFKILHQYITNSELNKEGSQNVLVQISSKLKVYESDYSEIIIEDMGNQLPLYVAAYCNIAPCEYRKLPKTIEKLDWDHFTLLGKYHFVQHHDRRLRGKPDEQKRLLVMKLKNEHYPLLDSVVSGIHKIYFCGN